MTEKNDGTNPQHVATIEHLYPPGNDPTWISWCCNSCNASHKKPLREWFKSRYCIKRGINESTVAPIITQFLASGLKESDQLWLDGSEDKFLKSALWSEPTLDGQQSILKSGLIPNDAKSFDRVQAAISSRRYEFGFRGLVPGMFGRYYGFMYWIVDDTLNRIPFPD